jgi:hypothetical protein
LRQGAWVDDVLHHDRRGETAQPRQGGESVVVEPLEAGEVDRDDPQKIVRVAEEALRLQDLRDRAERALEGGHGVVTRPRRCEEDVGARGSAEPVGDARLARVVDEHIVGPAAVVEKIRLVIAEAIVLHEVADRSVAAATARAR